MRPGDAERTDMATEEFWQIKGREWLRTLNMFDDEELSQFEKNLKADLESLLGSEEDHHDNQ